MHQARCATFKVQPKYAHMQTLVSVVCRLKMKRFAFENVLDTCFLK